MRTLTTSPSEVGNNLLAAIPDEERVRLLRGSLAGWVETGDVLYEPGTSLTWVWFPLSAVISIVTVLKDGSSVEVATVGREGMVGTFVFLGDDHNPNGRAITQMDGELLRVNADVLRHEVDRSPWLRAFLHDYTRAMLVQVSQGVACAAAHSVKERLARWLLQTSDRVVTDDVQLTHDFLAGILHARRASITVALRELQDDGVVLTRRGGTLILDRDGLADQACECYAFVRAQYERLLPGEHALD
jgi:CRP-like cAMP-binding protein